MMKLFSVNVNVNDDASRKSWIHLRHAFNSLLQGEQNIIKTVGEVKQRKN